ncbi:TetR/AcrR family transcriptional regulator [Promicromonospora citrea]|uniref:TetR family transcriptional regulator n=1 Tax=Promicromonospora citrea TaxID=43677 RepID=A0A8H9GQC0_9MICO|nr:TetR/AcrR family transcriptional regulator [Promicromonospora citrea]NNH52236.1 TetR/AcrR family transcriptional regulator [Promicromonospora citrea]GGM40001.1 TetR family transcriptional regulator [Promicromonospora citrea]
MPRITAATVAEHRQNQRRAVLEAARSLLAETGQAPSLAAVGKRAGLARTSVYEYARSREDLLAAVVADVFPDWTRRIRSAIDAAPTPGEKVWAYVESNVAFFGGSEQAVARALGSVVEPAVLRGPMQDFHTALQEPLRDALRELGDPDPDTTADIVDAMLLSATQEIRGRQREATTQEREAALAPLRRLLGPYLGLPQD